MVELMTTREQSRVPLDASIAPARTGVLQRKCACGGSIGLSGSCAECQQKKLLGKPLQTKLRINEPGDRYEEEADRVAEEVLRMAGPRSPMTNMATASLVQRRTNAPGGGEATGAPSLVHDVLSSPGQPLDAVTRAFFEPRFGHDFSQVRVHCDERAAESARMVSAHAYTVGHHIVFGAGRFAPETREGRRLLGHELTHTVQQRSGHGERAVQRDPVDDVRDKLSYGLFDWAITDAEAMEAFALLTSVPEADLKKVVSGLGEKYITRLLDNLPDAAKTGKFYQQLTEAIGSGGLTPYATDLLSYGLFDWAVTDAEVSRVFSMFTNLPPAAQEQFLDDLHTAGRLGRLISNATTAHHALYIRPWISSLRRGALTNRQRKLLRTFVIESSNDAIQTLILTTETRFDVTVGRTTIPGRTPKDWKPDLLRQAYLALTGLPDAHVAKNKELLRLGQFEQAARNGFLTAGVYNAGRRELAINTKAGDIRDDLTHEVGHAVDKEMGWSTSPEPAKPERGGWKDYGVNHNDCATEMVDDSGGAIKSDLAAPQRADVIDEMSTVMGNRSSRGLEADIRGLPWFAGLPRPIRNDVLRDAALKALEIGLDQPWFKARDGGEHLGSHVYQEGYPNDWVRYRHEARSRMVTKYQFRDPGEWFAEAYSYYYRPDPRGVGAKLADKDPDTKAYFDSDVHTRGSSR